MPRRAEFDFRRNSAFGRQSEARATAAGCHRRGLIDAFTVLALIFPMLVHTVYFWLKPELTAAQRADFRKGVESLGGIKSVEKIYVGVPAKTEKRPIIDDSYSVALTVLCKDIAAHDAYQVDPIHLAFVNTCKQYWNRVQIYDAE